MKTNLLQIALENQINIFPRKEQFYCLCPNCLKLAMELNPEHGYFCCYNCGIGGDAYQFDDFYSNIKNPF